MNASLHAALMCGFIRYYPGVQRNPLFVQVLRVGLNTKHGRSERKKQGFVGRTYWGRPPRGGKRDVRRVFAGADADVGAALKNTTAEAPVIPHRYRVAPMQHPGFVLCCFFVSYKQGGVDPPEKVFFSQKHFVPPAASAPLRSKNALVYFVLNSTEDDKFIQSVHVDSVQVHSAEEAKLNL